MKNKINFDGILSFFILAATIYADYIIFLAKTLPINWRYISIAIVTLIGLLLLALSFKKMKKTGTWIRRIMTILFIFLFAFTSINLDKVRNFTNRVTDVQDENIEKISVVVKADSKFDALSDLKNKTIYYQDGTDKSNAEFVMKKVESDVSKVKFKSENNYFSLAQQLMDGKIDAMIITNSYIQSVEDGLEGFEGSIRSLKTYERNVSKTEKKHTGADLDLTQDVFTVLISGMDETGSPNHNSRSDVNMLLMVNPKTNHIEMVSFPRDSFVPNPALGNASDKLTHTGNDGVENTMLAIEQVVGFDINFYVKVNFTSVVEFVDALGGIEVDVPIAFCEQDSERSFAEADLQCLEKGLQKVDGEEALAFARHRKTEGVGDIGRTHAQQKVIMGMLKKALTPSGATKVPVLLDIVPKYVVTNISDEQLNHFISYELENMKPWTTSQMTLENGYNANLITASMGGTPLSCYVLSPFDLEVVWQKYWLLNNPSTFKDFKFNLNNLNPENMPEMPKNANLVLYGDDLSKYLGVETKEPVEEEEKPVQPTPEPTVPEQPTTPEEPTTPENPTTPDQPTTPDSGNSDGGTTGGGNQNNGNNQGGTTTPTNP